MPVTTISGLNSGLDTDEIVQGLLDIQQTQIDRLTLRKNEAVQKEAAFQLLEAQLVQFQSAASRLGRTQNNVFESRTVSVSSESALVASADSDATPGIYQITVESLAQAHQVASQGLAEADSQITQGTFTIRQGSSPALDITIDDTNDTLQGLADSINLAEIGISASIVQDGSGSGAPARLLLSSSKTGEDNAIIITNNLAASSGGAVKPEFDFGNPVQSATNAEIRLGSGPGALTVETSENRVENVISGVTLDLLEADTDAPITIRVSQDTDTAVDAVGDFVSAYNSLISFVDTQTQFVPEGESGLLIGNRSLLDIEADVQNALQTIVPGVNTNANRLSTVGITIGDTGKLSLNTNTLINAINGDVDGVIASDVRSLFALDGTSDNPNIQFVLGSSRTQESTSAIEVDITQAAERASITGTNTIAASTVIDGSNKELTLTIDNAQLTVSLTEGTYTDSELAAELESIINAHPDASGRTVAVGLEDDGFGSNSLTITSNTFGGSSQVTINSGTGLADLGLSGIENDQGVDVAGSFIVNGVAEEAVGRGRLLVGDEDNENTADLQVRVTMTASQVEVGSDGELLVSRGFASRIDQMMGDFLDSETGLLKSITDRFQTEADNIQASIDRQEEIFSEQEQDLLAQFVALERALGELETTSSFLTQQFANLSSLSK